MKQLFIKMGACTYWYCMFFVQGKLLMSRCDVFSHFGFLVKLYLFMFILWLQSINFRCYTTVNK